MYLYDVCLSEPIDLEVKIDKEIETVYDLSYLLIDFQSVVHGINDMLIEDRCIVEYNDNKLYIPNILFERNEEKRISREELLTKKDNEHPIWQRELEDSFNQMLNNQNIRKVANRAVGYKQTTSRAYNKARREQLRINHFSKGCLFLDLAMNVASGIIIEFLKELLIKKTGNENIMRVDFRNTYIVIDGSEIKYIPKSNQISSAIRLTNKENVYEIDSKTLIKSIVDEAKPDENIEESVKRLFDTMRANGLIESTIGYDDRGMKTFVRDTERLVGSLIDIRL